MKTKAFDIETAREFIGDDRVRYFEQMAAQDVAAGSIRDITRPTNNWQQELTLSFEMIVYYTAYDIKNRAKERRNQVYVIDEELMTVVRSVVEQQKKAFEQYCAGNEKAVGAIIGAVMKIQRFDPKQVKQAVDSLKTVDIK